jgi:hypothetical protein
MEFHDLPAADVLAQARERTLTAATARIALSLEHTWALPPRSRRRQGGVLRPVTSVAKAAGRRLQQAATHRFGHQAAEGVVDVRGRRCMLDYGSFAQLYAGGRRWDGRSGRLLSTLPSEEPEPPTPLWLLDLLTGFTAPTDEGDEEVRGAPCRRMAATVDLSRASEATAGGLAVPALKRFDDLLALTVEVCVDGEHVRRVRFRSEQRTDTLELWDFGVSLDELDWSRLPAFRSPNEAAAVAEGRR